MKRRPPWMAATKQPVWRRTAGFTMTELMVTLAVTMLVLSGLIGAYMFGMRLLEFTRPKLSASDQVRKTIGRLVAELRSADRIQVGEGSLSSFTVVADGDQQTANAIRVYPTTNDATFWVYYRDPADRSLKRATNGATRPEVIANSVSNSLVFTFEDFQGNLLTNTLANPVVGVSLQFQQTNFLTKVGTNRFYDSYQVRTKITKRPK